ncbi:hypothetical protein HV198_13875 [Citrobacter freundii]|uniref:hypothetical protein n=1 Tax=Citrobacter freundii TaxID=546 RepID=UPI0015E51149|nr:hypothetical protein [Citrobacter freundii]QLO42314.1 hypothetical protein HV215_09200 [Citrobacter freundii]QLO43173.1 hypothetical protein HV215_13875 [Citrobacter freundii]QLV40478.1 hypothetical protein HV198_09200 [Citrobacter freundii]QLV41337.1 hypothetical protein HV198_13875 [Citrobacter freundii]
MSAVWVFKVDGKIVGVSWSPQEPLSGISWIKANEDDAEIVEWLVEHKVCIPEQTAAED